MLAQIRPQLDAVFDRYAGGADLLKILLSSVRAALVHGIRLIFVSSAAIMTAAIILNLLLRNIPLRRGAPQVDAPPH
jgi:hypothetical protein